MFTFIDLFSGIGGFRIALERLGGKCIGFSEIDKLAIKTYRENFHSPGEIEFGDITKIGRLPKVDVLVGGVPCQSWSVAGKMRGFDDPRGKLWHDSIRLVEINQPKVFIFENVKGLSDPRNKENLDLILSSLRKLNYTVFHSLLNSYDFGLPQNRDRIFIVGFRRDIKLEKSFGFPHPINKNILLQDILESVRLDDVNKIKLKSQELFGSRIPASRNRFQKDDELNDFFVMCDTRNGHTTIHSWDLIQTTDRQKHICMTILKNRRKKKYGNNDGNPLTFENLTELIPKLNIDELNQLVDMGILKYKPGTGFEFVNSKNSAGINGIYRIYLPNSPIFSTLTATGTKDMIATTKVDGKTPEEFRSHFIETVLIKGNYRTITPREAARLQGFPESFKIYPHEKVAQKQFGNAVSVNVVYHLMKSVVDTGVFKVFNSKKYGRKNESGNPTESEKLDEGYNRNKSFPQYS